MTIKKNLARAFTIGAVALAFPAFGAITSADGTVAAPTVPQERMGADFSQWAGSTANANSLVDGLRRGTPVTLTGTEVVNGTAVPTTTTFTPPTKPMGNGNIFNALALAKAELAAQGITSPTPAQLETALMGGSLTVGTPPRVIQVQGVLQLRADGMGWGKIAQVYGLKLGPVISGMKAAHPKLVSGINSAGRVTNASGTSSTVGKGVTQRSASTEGILTGNGTGATQRAAHSQGVVTANGNAGGGNSGRGIVSASGAGGAGAGAANASSRSIVSAGGVSGATNGQGQARGHVK